MNSLGLLYSHWTDPPDLDAARQWYERAADAGNHGAMNNLGWLLHKQMDPPDLDAAWHWYERAADAGHSRAKVNLVRWRADVMRSTGSRRE
jgi:TPR repeat protein